MRNIIIVIDIKDNNLVYIYNVHDTAAIEHIHEKRCSSRYKGVMRKFLLIVNEYTQHIGRYLIQYFLQHRKPVIEE